ncbi:FAD-dependent oxidoreductase [Aquimarina sp. BL5]|uniref:NAD(P)/FAD-dependent oxidoreductase n=1 Tax=Aquimarina sp. BL5 TaxID=1714860 RepID=UPI000E49A97C|nr:FAD-dependent oxidoreductase [Aquimarina sp. BL5]AXT49976.1 FAD-dependent oxidoreductase [Aquimarina sp. BL5]RKM92396.1 FAD-dependent oxidoreductase [Aquimarina sp. BL5]
MQHEFSIQVTPEIAADSDRLKSQVSRKNGISLKEIRHIQILKRSIDARQKAIKVNLKIKVYVQEDFVEESIQLPEYPDVSKASEIVIIGAGPAGLFAALRCVELGYKPIVLERGKDVRNRRRDLKAINRDHIVNEDSNYCFGEGGAGTYSDGKLYTRSKKRGDVNRILQLLVAFGATDQILVEAHPHIGTNKLPAIIAAIREKIKEHGGEIHFETRVTDFSIKNSKIAGVTLQNGDTIDTNKVILATGHSARDVFELLYKKQIEIEAKPFALGVRVEHSQQLIDQIQYKCDVRGPYLPPSPYSIVKQVKGRGMYSFCMCPGGVIAPCATSPGEVVTNGWSPSKRDQPTSNSGIVVELRLEDFKEFSEYGPLAGIYFQKKIEQQAWLLAGETQRVPAQRLVDLTQGKTSLDLPETSYKPGLTSVDMNEVFPKFIHNTLREGFKAFDKSMRGYLTNEAVVHAPESRTSSPVRIPRDRYTLEHTQIKGLYPCGEGAGYAGGIISAAIDGEKCTEACVATIA